MPRYMKIRFRSVQIRLSRWKKKFYLKKYYFRFNTFTTRYAKIWFKSVLMRSYQKKIYMEEVFTFQSVYAKVCKDLIQIRFIAFCQKNNHFLLNAVMQKIRFKSVSIGFYRWEKIYLKKIISVSMRLWKYICKNLIQIRFNAFLPMKNHLEDIFTFQCVYAKICKI